MFEEQFLIAFQVGAHYLLVALGFSLMLGVLRVANLAYGEIMMGAGFASLFVALAGGGRLLVVLTSVMAAILLGLFIHVIAVRPLGHVSDVDSPRHLAVIVSTLGVSIALQNIAVLLFGGYPTTFPNLLGDRQLPLGKISIGLGALVDIGVSAALVVILMLVLNRSRFGLRVRALSSNESLARTMGISTGRDKLITVALSSAIAGLSAVLIFQNVGSVSPFSGSYYGLKAIIVVITAGIADVRAVAVTAFALAFAEVFFTSYVSSAYRDGFAFLLLIIVLLVRRQVVPNFGGGR